MSIKAKIIERFVSVNKKKYLGSNTFTEIKKMQSHDITAGDKFGHSVAASDTRIVVGAPEEDTGGSNAGSAYIFDIDGTQIAKIQAGDKAAGDQFGFSVAVSSNRIVIGAPLEGPGGSAYSGSAYIFDIHGNQLAKITANDAEAGDAFGISVAASDTKIVVGAWSEDTGGSSAGAAYIYNIDGSQISKIQASDKATLNQFGWSVAASNNRIVVGARKAGTGGAVYIFDVNGTQLTKITASDAEADDQFGYAVAASDTNIIVGAPLEDTGGSDAGAAYIYDLDGNQISKITASDAAGNDNFGWTVGVTNTHVIVGAFLGSAAYVFDLKGNQLSIITASDGAGGWYGYSVDISSSRMVIGAPTVASSAGAAYVNRRYVNSYNEIPWAKIRLKFTGDAE